MLLEEVIEWLGGQLTNTCSDAFPDREYVLHRDTRLIKAKGCTLSYWSMTEIDRYSSVCGYQKREIWTLDLHGLDPARVNGLASGQVWFRAAGTSRNAIRTLVYRSDTIVTAYGNRKMGHFSVRDKVDPAEVAAGLRHAVELCQQRGQ